MDENKTFFRRAQQNQLGFKDIFRDVFRRHTPEENTRLFMAGTALTTPDEASMLSKWLRPYLFARLFLAGMLIMAVTYVMSIMGYILFLPFLFVAGSFLAPITVMILFWEMNIPRNVSFPTVIAIFFLGGMLSLVFTVILNPLKPSEGVMSAMATGLVEETAKVLALMVWMRGRDKKYILTGMLVGSAVGAGFAAVESAGYAVVNTNWSFLTLILRAVLAPGGHVTWAAISGGALAWAKAAEPLSVKHLFHPVFLSLFAFSVITHGLWDSAGSIFVIFGLELLIMAAAYWVMKQGVAQIVRSAVKRNDDRLTLALNHDLFGGLSGEERQRAEAAAGAGAGRAPVQAEAESGKPGAEKPPQKPQREVHVRMTGLKGTFSGRRFSVEGRVRMGRDPGRCDLVFPADTAGVSGAHCEIIFSTDHVSIQDLGSTYGTFVNGNRLDAGTVFRLRSGDHVCLGSASQEFEITVG